jgi:hypothetical protein
MDDQHAPLPLLEARRKRERRACERRRRGYSRRRRSSGSEGDCSDVVAGSGSHARSSAAQRPRSHPATWPRTRRPRARGRPPLRTSRRRRLSSPSRRSQERHAHGARARCQQDCVRRRRSPARRRLARRRAMTVAWRTSAMDLLYRARRCPSWPARCPDWAVRRWDQLPKGLSDRRRRDIELVLYLVCAHSVPVSS